VLVESSFQDRDEGMTHLVPTDKGLFMG
jgi:hypothetical protein